MCVCVSREVYEGEGELSLDGLYGLEGKAVCVCVRLCLQRVCVGSMCKASVARLVCMCVFVCVPCGPHGQTQGIKLTDVTVSLYAGVQTRHIRRL